MEAKLKNIKQLEQLEQEDPNVKNVLVELRDLYAKKLDTMDEHELIRIGGRLLGLYASLGATSSRKRAERDATEQTYEEMLASQILHNKDGYANITEARAIAKQEMQEFTQEIIKTEQVKNAYEAITSAVEKSITFIQSAIKVKQSERISTNKFADQNGGYDNTEGY
jgi:DNA-binding ferritin-like protein